MPAKPTEYPVLFDESGTEYKVGLYKRADGKVKNVYKKTMQYTVTSKGDFILSANFRDNNNIDTVVSLTSISDNTYPQSEGLHGMPILEAHNLIVFVEGSGTVNWTIHVTIQYTKTTDEFRDL